MKYVEPDTDILCVSIQASVNHFAIGDKFRRSLIQFHNLYAVLRTQDSENEHVKSFYFFLLSQLSGLSLAF